jgi:hypothetical protein
MTDEDAFSYDKEQIHFANTIFLENLIFYCPFIRLSSNNNFECPVYIYIYICVCVCVCVCILELFGCRENKCESWIIKYIKYSHLLQMSEFCGVSPYQISYFACYFPAIIVLSLRALWILLRLCQWQNCTQWIQDFDSPFKSE